MSVLRRSKNSVGSIFATCSMGGVCVSMPAGTFTFGAWKSGFPRALSGRRS